MTARPARSTTSPSATASPLARELDDPAELSFVNPIDADAGERAVGALEIALGHRRVARATERTRDIALAERLENFGTRVVGDTSEQGGDEANVPDLQRGLADREPASLERLREQRQDLGIGQRTVAADELDAGLEDLARPAGHGGFLAEHRSDVREPEHAGQGAVATRDEARHAWR